MCEDLAFLNGLLGGISSPSRRLPTLQIWQKFGGPEIDEWNRREVRLAQQEMNIMEHSYEGIVQVVNRVEEFINTHQHEAVFSTQLYNIGSRLGNAEIILSEKHSGDATLLRRIRELRRRLEAMPRTKSLSSTLPSYMKKPSYPDVCRPSPTSTGLCQPSTRSYNDDRDDCPICMDILASREISRLRCGHSFHKTCVDEWLAEHRTCPMCRANV